MKLSAGAFSDPGRVRDNNEDAHLVDDRLTRSHRRRPRSQMA